MPVIQIQNKKLQRHARGTRRLPEPLRTFEKSSSSWSARSGGFRRRLDPGDVDFIHRHHRLEGALCRVMVGTCRQVKQPPRRDLPGKAPTVLAPAAGALDASIPDDRIPVAVGLFLAFGNDHEADRFIRREIRTAVETDEPPPEHREFDGQLAAFVAAGKITGGSVHPAYMAVGKCRGVEFRRLACFAVVEPQACNQIGWHVIFF
jgi:hypothetical protein